MEVGRGEIDGDLVAGETEAGTDEGAPDALSGFADGFVGHANDVECREAVVHAAFDLYEPAVETIGDGGVNLGNHGQSISIHFLKNNPQRELQGWTFGAACGKIRVVGADKA